MSNALYATMDEYGFRAVNLKGELKRFVLCLLRVLRSGAPSIQREMYRGLSAGTR